MQEFTFDDYIKYSKRLKDTMFEFIVELLKKGNEVVLDFPANTVSQREWFKNIFETANVEHIMYYVKRSDEVCK